MADNDSTSAAAAPPYELQGIAHQLDQLTPPARASALAAIQAVVAAMFQAPVQQQLPPLTSEQRAVIDYLREHGVSSAANIAHHVGYDERTIKRWCAPDGPLRAHGIAGTRRGYSVT